MPKTGIDTVQQGEVERNMVKFQACQAFIWLKFPKPTSRMKNNDVPFKQPALRHHRVRQLRTNLNRICFDVCFSVALCQELELRQLSAPNRLQPTKVNG